MFGVFPSLSTVYFLELQGLNVVIEKDCVLCEVRTKFFYNLNESLFPRVATFLILFYFILILVINSFVLIQTGILALYNDGNIHIRTYTYMLFNCKDEWAALLVTIQ